MSTRIESRSTQIDTELCVEHAGGRYDLVIAAAQRLREMKRRARETNDFITPIDALKEVQSGTFNMQDYLAMVLLSFVSEQNSTPSAPNNQSVNIDFQSLELLLDKALQLR